MSIVISSGKIFSRLGVVMCITGLIQAFRTLKIFQPNKEIKFAKTDALAFVLCMSSFFLFSISFMKDFIVRPGILKLLIFQKRLTGI